jgi:co-chaperonin GroES (HSP10)
MSETIAVQQQGLILPPGVINAIPPEDVEYQNAETKASQMPAPKGWRILCALVDVADTYDSGLIKSSSAKRNEEITSPVLFVIKFGDLAYKDEQKFPTGPWCQEGDFIITRPYTGTRIMIHGKEFRVIYDDQVEAVVQDPRGISRV